MPDTDILSINGAVASLTINNPPLNILTDELRWRLYHTIEELRLSASVRVLIVRGAGERAFSVGSDLKGFPLDDTGLGGVEKVTFEQRMYSALQTLPQVTIGALSGYVLGGGAEFALSCDLRIAADSLRIGFPEINIGNFSGASGTQLLVRQVGPAKARELMFFGEQLDASEALRLGLVNRVVPQEILWSEASAWAEKLADKPWLALQAIKTCVRRGADLDYDAGLRLEAEESAKVYRSHDAREGVAAFKAKRVPVFRHQ